MNGRVYCLPDVRAQDLSLCLPPNPFLTPIASPQTSDQYSYDSSDNDHVKTETADVCSFYGQKNQNRSSVDRSARRREPAATAESQVNEPQLESGRPVSPADSLSAIYSSDDEEMGESPESVGISKLSQYFASLSSARPVFDSCVYRPPTDYMNNVRESLHRVAAHQGVDLTPDGVREQIRKRERQEIADQLQAQDQTERLRNMGFDGNALPSDE